MTHVWGPLWADQCCMPFCVKAQSCVALCPVSMCSCLLTSLVLIQFGWLGIALMGLRAFTCALVGSDCFKGLRGLLRSAGMWLWCAVIAWIVWDVCCTAGSLLPALHPATGCRALRIRRVSTDWSQRQRWYAESEHSDLLVCASG